MNKMRIILNFNASKFHGDTHFLELLLYAVVFDDQASLIDYITDYDNYEDLMNEDDFAIFADNLIGLGISHWSSLTRSLLPPVRELFSEHSYHIVETIIKSTYVIFNIEIHD